jgi:pimeloyl-ACP methyl ester carboxylesterase
MEKSAIKYKRADVDGFGVAYREAGPASGQALLLLHCFPTSSHMFGNLIPKLADRYRGRAGSSGLWAVRSAVA